ncbi:MAG: Na+/H+ antiporter NhaA [Bacteroidales bacterium]|nr:Na+/H+ antiporter NhaA [Bacteroidales bacterium]
MKDREQNKAVSGFNISHFVREESLAGFLLILVTVIAMIWANSRWHDLYHYIWHEIEVGFSFGSFGIKTSLHHWINDGLMALFFFTLGLEIKREMLSGELASVRKAALPVFAALGGMLVPASIYAVINYDDPVNIRGWGIPMATDIAFALGLLSLLGNRVNINLKIFLTALAIADDLGAIMIIAVFYTESINLMELLNAGIFLSVLIIANRLGVRRTTFYALVGGLGVWMSFLYSGIHATIAGVLIAMTIPVRARVNERTFIRKLCILLDKFRKVESNDSALLTQQQAHLINDIEKLSQDAHTPLQKLEHALHPVISYLVLPLFAISNAGVHVESNIFSLVFHPVAVGIIAGLLLGKFIGVALFSRIIVRLKWASLPTGVTWRQIYGVGFLAGIGFTMSIFITDLAFLSDQTEEIAKVAILTDAILAAVIGMIILGIKPRFRPPSQQPGPDRPSG